MRHRARVSRSLLLVVRSSPLTEREAPPAPAASGEEPCGACGAALQPGQEWCLECGAARTVLQRPPDWRVPAVVIAVVIVVIVIGLLIALVSLSIQANHA